MKISGSSMFQALLPDPEQTWLLQACLMEKIKAAESWDLWLNRVQSPMSEFKKNYAFKTLAPLLHSSFSKKEIEPPAEIATFLRIAYLQEKLRAETLRACSRDVLNALVDAEILFLVLKGVVLAELYYENKGLRHTHDLDLYVNPEAVTKVFTILRNHQIDPLSSQRNLLDGRAIFRHRSGLNIALHTKLFSIPHYDPPISDIWKRARTVPIAEVNVRVLEHTDMLMHVLGHAACSYSRNNLRWVCDCVFILKHQKPDWRQFIETSAIARLSLVSFVMLTYLRNKMGAEVPQAVLDQLRNQPDANTVASAESLLQGVRLGSKKTFRLFAIAHNWYDPLLLLKWIVAPHPMSTIWRNRIRRKWLVPLYYLYRPLRYLAGLTHQKSENHH